MPWWRPDSSRSGRTAPALIAFHIRRCRSRRLPNEMGARARRRRAADAGSVNSLMSGTHVPQSKWTSQQHAAAFAGHDRTIIDLVGKLERGELRDAEWIQGATVRCGHTN